MGDIDTAEKYLLLKLHEAENKVEELEAEKKRLEGVVREASQVIAELKEKARTK